MRRTAALSAAAVAGCFGSAAPRAQCVFDDECGTGLACFEGACTPGAHTDGGLGWCPALQPRLSDIDRRLFKVSCSSAGGYCHNVEAAQGPNANSGLDLSGDPWPALVGVKAENVAAHADAGAPLFRVVPGDPGHSFLVTKLGLRINNDAYFGSGMPPLHPGALCPEAQGAIAEWIAQGAQRN